MKNICILILFLSFPFMKSTFNGYAILDYKDINDNKAYDIQRVNFGYKKIFNENILFGLAIDARENNDALDDKIEVNLLNVFIDWTINKNSIFSIGLLETNTFKVQEDTWGLLYVEKGIVEKYAFTHIADFGIGFSRFFKGFNFNLQLLSGKGYIDEDTEYSEAIYGRLLYGTKNLKEKNGYNFGAIYYKNSAQVLNKDNDNILTSLFAGFSTKNLRFGIEKNKYNSWATIGFFDLENKILANSIYLNCLISSNISLFFRKDVYEINSENPVKTEISGISYQIFKGFYISPNIYKYSQANLNDLYKLSIVWEI